MIPTRLPRRPLVLAALLMLAAQGAAAQAPVPRRTAEDVARAEAEARYVLPPAKIQELFRRDPSFAVLDAPSPDRRRFLVPRATELSTLERMGQPTLRLAELEIRPATDRLWHLDTYGIVGLRVFDLASRRYTEVPLPAGTFASDLVWSPDGARFAFLAHLPGGTELWTADAATGRAARLADARILATLGTEAQTEVQPSRMVQWTPEGSVLTLAVPAGRGAEPARPLVPTGPTVRETRPSATPTRTFANLLRDPHDATLLEHYTRSQLVELAAGQAPRPIGEPRMYESIALSPDGRHLLATYLEKPFSFITSYQGFPRRAVVLDRATGRELATLENRALREGSAGRGGRDADAGRRLLAWHPAGAGLVYVRRAAGTGDRRPEQVMLLPAPFDTTSARVVGTSADPIRSLALARDGTVALGTTTGGGRTRIVAWPLDGEPAEPRRLAEFHPDSLLAHPGEIWTERTANGVEFALTTPDGASAYLRGDGLRADFRPRPFVDRVALADGRRERVWEGAADAWERPLVALDPAAERMIVAREGVHDFPDSFLWTRGGGAMTDLTRNPDPFPELTAAQRMDFSFERRDGLQVQGRVSLPLGYREGQKVPAIFWTYPREFTTAEGYTRAALQARNRNAYTHLTWLRWSDLWLTQGYALVYPDIPIIGENYNDAYISNMVDAMYGAMRAVDGLGVIDMDRIGHGGHSYGAFATVNLLAHTPFFQAGIAGDGAYNRSLTPTGFQAEPRDIWSAPTTYLDMSPFFLADQINTPLLMYHGAADNNTGTWPIQSERMMHALTALGKTAALYLYPYESHTPRAIENNLDMWARWIDWFDRYVKQGDER